MLKQVRLYHIILGVALILNIIGHLRGFSTPVQGKDVWRQSKTAWNIRFFAREDPNIFNPRRPYLNEENTIDRYELPLMQWSIAMVERMLGESVFIKRMSVFIISLFSLLAAFRLAKLLTDDVTIAALSVFCFTFLPAFFYNATSILPDGLALCFALYYTLYFFRYLKHYRAKDLWLSALFIALAGLTKLPFILMGICGIILGIRLLRKHAAITRKQRMQYFTANALALVPVLAWYGFVIPGWKGNDIAAGISATFAGWPKFFQYLEYHVFNSFPNEVLNFPALMLFFTGIAVMLSTRKLSFTSPVYFFAPWLLLSCYFLYVLSLIKDGHEYYLLPFYPVFLLTIIPGIEIIYKSERTYRVLLTLLFILMPILCWQRVNAYWGIGHSYMNESMFKCRDQLSAIGSNEDLAIVINDASLCVFSYAIDKKSFTFWNNHLPISWIQDIVIRHNVKYLYSDSRVIEEQEGFNEVADSLILTCGNINVWHLKQAGEIAQ